MTLPLWAAWPETTVPAPIHELWESNGDVVACGETGCWSVAGSLVTEVPHPCPRPGPCLARAGDWRAQEGAIVHRDGVPVPAGTVVGPVRLAAFGDSLFVADDTGIRRWRDGSWAAITTDPTDLLTIAPNGLWWRDGSAWRGTALVPPLLPGILAAAGGPDGVWLVHKGLLGFTSGADAETAWPLENALVVVWDGGVGIASGTRVWQSPVALAALEPMDSIREAPSPSLAPTAEPTPSTPSPTVPLRPPVGGFATPWTIRADGTIPSTYDVYVDLGLLAGSTVGGGRGIGGSPFGGIGIVNHGGRVSWWTGTSSAPLFLQAGDQAVWPLLMLDVGADVGGAHLRAGPYATAGLVAVGAGLRGYALPIRLPNGAWSGVEGRITVWTGPDAVDGGSTALIGSASLAWAGHFALGRKLDVESEGGAPWCARAGFGLGVAGGPSNAENAWEFLGAEDPWTFSASPLVTGWCETGGPVALFWSAETAPFFQWRTPFGTGDESVHLWGSTTAGPSVGTESVRLGPIGSAGVWMLGAGGRLWVSPPLGLHPRPGLELRALALWPSTPAYFGSAVVTISTDPRRNTRP